MAWIVKNTTGGTIIITELNIQFSPNNVRDMDLIGRENAERSSQFKGLLANNTLLEIKKDMDQTTATIMAKVETVAVKVAENHEVHQNKLNELVEIAEKANTRMADIERTHTEMRSELAKNTDSTNKVLDEVRAFAEKFPLQVKTIAEAMRNIQTERSEVAYKLETLPESGMSDAEMKVQERLLSMRDKKLEKNVKNLGSTVSQSADDFNESLDALEKLNL